MIGLLIEKQIAYTEVEADALITDAKRLAGESGRTVRGEAELLLSRDTEARLRDLRNRVVAASGLLAVIAVDIDDLRAESGDLDGELASIMATMTISCQPFTSVPVGGSTSTTEPGEPPASSAAVEPRPTEDIESALP